MTDLAKIENILFRPYKLGQLELGNRLVMAPMTRERAPNGIISQEHSNYYKRRAESGVGLIITEGVWIDEPVASDRKTVPRFYGDDALAGWIDVVAAVHAAGGKIMPQLWHVGAAAERSGAWNAELPAASPSGIALYPSPARSPKALSDREIADCIDAYARAASNAKHLGFDGIELHAAHGYLIDEFFWDATNNRGDSYNGGIAQRTRFAAEIIRECRRRTGPLFPISLRFSQWKSSDYDARLVKSPQELSIFLEPLIDSGVDIFHCSTRRFWMPAFEDSSLTLAGWTKKLSGKTTIAVGSVGLDRPHETRTNEGRTGYSAGVAQIDELLEMMERDEFDLIAIGRALLVDHRWPEKVRAGAFSEMIPYSTELRNRFY